MKTNCNKKRVLFHRLKNIRLIDTAIAAISILLALGFWTRSIPLVFLLIATAVMTIKHKAPSKKERGRRETLFLNSFTVALFVPIIIIFSFILFLIARLIPLIVAHWHG